jgi:hypothetical protein
MTIEDLPVVAHTPEPWRVEEDEDGVFVAGPYGYRGNPDDFRVIIEDAAADPDDPEIMANARRIVACVNACAGIPTEALENDGINAVLAITDKLLAIIEAAAENTYDNEELLQVKDAWEKLKETNRD